MNSAEVIDAVLALTGRYEIQDPQWHQFISQTVGQIVNSGKYMEGYWEGIFPVEEPDNTVYVPTGANEWGPPYPPIFGVAEVVMAIHADGSSTLLQPRLPRDIAANRSHCFAVNTYYGDNSGIHAHAEYPIYSLLVGSYEPAPPPSAFQQDWARNHWAFQQCFQVVVAGVCASVYRYLGERDTYSMYELEFQRLLAQFKAGRSDGGVR